ncbi:hypothetical protein ASG87_11530 [Frateuria sp. Soil773]|uniref:Flp pilus assembly protein CpaB n=1 Tax=Frateuria sp. Soil773 TaxID=1736407 RepID=UPI0006FB6175|nr:Flp pilus assembly protein CpaB [Frateuria sp. Soil773]KRF02106.1 hypothetical protein ASG87_11530 [Frateuria sp. Soil773]
MQKFTRLAALLLVAVAVILAIAAFTLGRRTTKPAEAPAGITQAPAPQGGRTSRQGEVVVVAATALKAGTPIAASALRLDSVAQRPVDGYDKVDAVAGGIPLLDIPAGTVLTSNLLARGVAMALRPGERAMAVPVDEQAGAGNRVLPGDYVDVFLSLKSAQPAAYGKAATDGTQTRLLLSRLRVLAYGGQDLPRASAEAGDKPPAKDGATRNTEQESRPVARTAVLAVPVQDADRLLLGVQNGKLSLAVRHPRDDGRPDDALFPQPRTVLTPRAGLSADQRALLDTPDNRAYAGIDGLGLAGNAHRAAASGSRPHRVAIPQAVEIIRGTSSDAARATRTSSP